MRLSNLLKHKNAPLYALIALLIFILAVRLVSLSFYPLMSTTEARYAEMSRKMLELNEWVMLYYYDYETPFWGKPPLSFWASAASMWLFGVNEFGARFAPFFFGLLCCGLFFAWQFRREVGENKALRPIACAVILSSTGIGFVASGAVMTDEALLFCVMLCMISFWKCVVGNSPLDLHSADLANFGRSQTQSLASRPKFAKNHESQTENPSVVLNAESKNNPSLRESALANSKQSTADLSLRGQIADSPEASVRSTDPHLQIHKDKMDCHDLPNASLAMTKKGLDCHKNSLRSFSRNDDKKTNSANPPQQTIEGIAVEVAEFLPNLGCETRLGVCEHSKFGKSPQDAPKSELPTEIAKIFNVKDGLALAYWAKTLNRKVAIITGRSSEILRARAKELGISELLFMDIRDKGAKVRELKERFALDSSQIATIGDDLNDIPMFKESHCNFAPSDCADALKSLPHTTILNAKGGGGAVREAIEIILKKESLYEAFISQFV